MVIKTLEPSEVSLSQEGILPSGSAPRARFEACLRLCRPAQRTAEQASVKAVCFPSRNDFR